MGPGEKLCLHSHVPLIIDKGMLFGHSAFFHLLDALLGLEVTDVSLV